MQMLGLTYYPRLLDHKEIIAIERYKRRLNKFIDKGAVT